MSYNGKRKKKIEKFADTTVSAEVQYIENTDLFLESSILVLPILISLFLNGKSKDNVNKELLNKKNLITLAVSFYFFNILGYNVAYGIPEGGYFGTFNIWSDGSAIETGYSDYSDNLYQTIFASVATLIALRNVNNSKAEIKDIVLIMLTIYTTFIYSLGMGWQWGGGWLSAAGYSDFSGSMICWGGPAVMSIIFTIIFPIFGDVKNLADKLEYNSDFISSLLLIIGFLGWNGGSQLAFGTFTDSTAVSRIMLNTLNFAFGSILAGVITGNYTPLPGLISSAAEPLMPTPIISFVVGFCSSILFHFATIFGIKSLGFKNKKDFGILASAIFGTLAVPLTNPDVGFGPQLMGVISYIILFAITSIIICTIMKKFPLLAFNKFGDV